MFFPWNNYVELESERRNTLQIFITNACSLKCNGCFARNVMGESKEHMSLEEYKKVIEDFLRKGGKQINLLGGEPLLHPELRKIIEINKKNDIKTTIYTNGLALKNYSKEDFSDVKLRLSLYCKSGGIKSLDAMPKIDFKYEVCFMVSKTTTVDELVGCAQELEKMGHIMFFISSLRELDNPNKEFFEDTQMTMNLIDYKKLVHEFLIKYEGKMQIHVSKRGVFESTKNLTHHKCGFANYFIGGKIIQCPYDIVNLKFQKDYKFNCRDCMQSNSCLMTKVIYQRK